MRIILLLAILFSVVSAQEPADLSHVEVPPAGAKPGFPIQLTKEGSYRISGVTFSPEQIGAIFKALKAQDGDAWIAVRSSHETPLDHMVTLWKLLDKTDLTASVTLDDPPAEQSGAGQPATRSESDSKGAVCDQQRDPFAGPLEKKAAELALCANGHKALKDIPVVYGHVGGLMSSPEVAAKAKRGEILFGGCLLGGRDHWVVCQTCGLRYDDEYAAWLETYPPRTVSPDGKDNVLCSLDTFQRILSNEILGIALKVAGDNPSLLSCSRWHEASEIVGEQAFVISKAKDSAVVQQLNSWFREKGGPKQPTVDRAEADGRTWIWESKDKVFVVNLSSSEPNGSSVSAEWHRNKKAQQVVPPNGP